MTDAQVRARAADDLIRLSNMFQGLLEIANHMKSIASLEQAAAEAEARIVAAQSDHKKVLETIEAAYNNADKIIERKHREADLEISSKLANRQSQLAGLEVSCDLVTGKLGEARAELNSLSAKIAEARSKLEGLGEQIEERGKAFKAVQEQHKALVASISNIK